MSENYITAMIVEDEYLILEDLQSIVDWESIGIRIVATALNGKQGITKYEKFRPQIVFTDIKMPDITGLDMIKSIKHLFPDQNTCFIVITAYSDFEYAKSAIRLGASDYILKSEISTEYILEKLSGIIKDMDDHRQIFFKALEKNISDIIFDENLRSYEQLEEVFRSPYIKDDSPEFRDLVRFVNDLLLQKYKGYQIENKFSPREIRTAADLCRYIYEELKTLTDLTGMIYQRNYSPTVINAMEYINKNYWNPDLMLKDIADAIHISVSRLCVLFKKELDKTVNDCLTEKRIEEAKKLLYLDNLKVYEVSDRVGYKTSQYFSKVFYQQTGQYPNDCRRPQELVKDSVSDTEA